MGHRTHHTRKRKLHAYSFAAHGHHHLVVEGKLVHCYLEGAFNEEGVSLLCQSLERAVHALSEWVLYVHSTPCTLATPEADYHARGRLLALSHYGCIGIVFQTQNVLMKRLAEKIAYQIHIPFFASDKFEELNQLATPLPFQKP